MSSLEPTKRTSADAGLLEAKPHPSKRNSTLPIAAPCSEHHDRRDSEGGFLDSPSELCLYIPPIETLPQELLLQVFEHFVHPSLITAGFPDRPVKHYGPPEDGEEQRFYHLRGNDYKPIDRKDLRNICFVSRQFKKAATTLLYRCAHLATAKSPGSFLLTLTAHPDLQVLVRHISVPKYLGVISNRFDFAFSHDTTNWMFMTGHELPPSGLEEEFFAQCGEYFGGAMLRLMVPLMPNLRTLIIPQTNLLDGPFTQDLVLPHLTALRITLMAPNEVTFYKYGFDHAVRTITWLSPLIGNQFPTLRRLEICSPNGRWQADLVTEEVETAEGTSPRKYAESLRTTTWSHMAPADWDLLTLGRPLFHPSKLHTLEFNGPGMVCNLVLDMAKTARWDFRRFFLENGAGLRTLSLDWERHQDAITDGGPDEKDIQGVYFGPGAVLTTLDKLTNLTHLTVSLQVLFGRASVFWEWVEDLKASPDTELAKLFPPWLRTLRVAEYVPGVFENTWLVAAVDEDDIIRYHGGAVYLFLQALRAHWLLRAGGRELWFRCNDCLDAVARQSGDHIGRDKIAWVMDRTVERDGEFVRVLRPPEDMVWGGGSDEDEETSESPDETATEDEDDEDPDGDWGQESWVY